MILINHTKSSLRIVVWKYVLTMYALICKSIIIIKSQTYESCPLLLLGKPWLTWNNPTINWRTNSLHFLFKGKEIFWESTDHSQIHLLTATQFARSVCQDKLNLMLHPCCCLKTEMRTPRGKSASKDINKSFKSNTEMCLSPRKVNYRLCETSIALFQPYQGLTHPVGNRPGQHRII